MTAPGAVRAPFRWTPAADRRLRVMLMFDGYTTSGAAEVLGCRHIEAVERAMSFGCINSQANRRVAALVSEIARKKRGQA